MSEKPAPYVCFCSRVLPETTERLIRTCSGLAEDGVSTVHLLISSPGGSVESGIAAYNLLRGMPFRLVTHNVGRVDSMGNALFLAGDRRYACANSSFMFHGVGFRVAARARFELRHLREKLQSVSDDQRKISTILAERTRLAPDVIEGLFDEGVTREPAYALEHGIIDEIRELEIPAGARILTIEAKH